MTHHTALSFAVAAVVGTLASGLISATATAQVPIPDPNTYLDLLVPALTDWNDTNTRTLVDPDDPAEGETFVYADEATKNLDLLGDGAGARAVILWELDDGSGRPPGIQVVTDDLAFPVQNCIMASGERESSDFPGTIVPKTCTDDEGSSKRFFSEMLEADVPIDFVFDTGMRTLRYKGVKDDDGGDAYEAFRDEYGTGRIYRVIAKHINQTDKRLVGFKVELGFGVGETFEKASFQADGVAFELRSFVPRPFFVGETGADPRVVWQPDRFALYARKLFFGPEPTERFELGFLDDEKMAGLVPPQSVADLPSDHPATGGLACSDCHSVDIASLTTQQIEDVEKNQFIFSGDDLVAEKNGYGAITPNYFDMAANQAFSYLQGNTGYLLGYWMPENIAPIVIGQYDEGDLDGESDRIVAWWDGQDWRYGIAGGAPDYPEVGPFGIVEDEQLVQWAALPLGLDPSVTPDDPVRYDAALSDDLSALNADYYIYLGEDFVNYEYELPDPETGEVVNKIPVAGTPKHDSITLRLTAVSAEGDGRILGTYGTQEPLWVANPAPELSTYMPADGIPVAINDSGQTMETDPVDIDILVNDLLNGAAVNPDPTEAAVTLALGPENGTATLLADNTVRYQAVPNFAGEDRFTYTVTVGEETSNVATVRVTVLAPPVQD
ncbi:MAG: choice-of-anchor F family protein, partial [Thioalkalivibrio sp.]|nr:choice-of-anchor F family protein [Thioalkalivibrio sp.]